MKPTSAQRARTGGVATEWQKAWPLRLPLVALGRYRFQPAWSMTLLTLVLVLLLSLLGVWQLSRGAEKERLITAFERNMALPRVVITADDFNPRQWVDRQVAVSGHYRAAPILLLNNQFNQGRLGFHRLGLFQLAGSERYLLVDRGWVPAAVDGKAILTDPAPRVQPQRLRGLLVQVPQGGLRLGELRYRPGASEIELPYLDLSWLGRVLGVDLSPLLLLQDQQVVAQYRAQRQATWLNPQRHRGYALQWFSLALALVVIYLVTNLKRPDPS